MQKDIHCTEAQTHQYTHINTDHEQDIPLKFVLKSRYAIFVRIEVVVTRGLCEIDDKLQVGAKSVQHHSRTPAIWSGYEGIKLLIQWGLERNKIGIFCDV